MNVNDCKVKEMLFVLLRLLRRRASVAFLCIAADLSSNVYAGNMVSIVASGPVVVVAGLCKTDRAEPSLGTDKNDN